MTQPIIKYYSNGEITVKWQPSLCIHSQVCFHGLPMVFNPQSRPWVSILGADSQTIMAQIDTCPSGALSYTLGDHNMSSTAAQPSATQISVMENGPLIVNGSVTIKLADGTEVVKETRCALCRCGASATKPYCDGAHRQINFQG